MAGAKLYPARATHSPKCAASGAAVFVVVQKPKCERVGQPPASRPTLRKAQGRLFAKEAKVGHPRSWLLRQRWASPLLIFGTPDVASMDLQLGKYFHRFIFACSIGVSFFAGVPTSQRRRFNSVVLE